MKTEGLTQKEVDERVQAGKVNGSMKRLTRSKKEIVKGNVFTYFNLVNIVLFVIVLFTGRFNNGLFIMTTVANTLIGIFQELKSKKLLDQMAIMVATHIEAERDGVWKEIPVEDIVVDDLIHLNAGDQIPVDADIVDGYLEVNESMLTGEADTVVKTPGKHVYAGTIVTSGDAQAVSIRVGHECFASQIMADAQKEKRAESKLHHDIEGLIRFISFAIIPLGIVLYITHKMYIGMGWADAVLKTIAAVVGMIPEGLVVLTSIALAVSVIRLSQQKVLVQDLFSIESLARIDTICLDKTGTLTQGKMTLEKIVPLGKHTEAEVKDIMPSYLYGDQKPNATSQALIDAFGQKEQYKKTQVLPFSSDRKYAGAALEGKGSWYLGAVNFLFPEGCPSVNKYLPAFTVQGERVIVLAHSDTETFPDTLPSDLEAVAMFAIRDVLRDNVKDIMQYFVKQGVDIRVISGDDPATVASLAKQAGIPESEACLDLSKLNCSMEEAIDKYTVFGRVMPDQKKKLVQALQKKGHVVAMTGDGVNDVPALKTADVSIAMQAGASAARDSANIVLLDNDFGRMPKIVGEGRRVINNISRASSMYLVKTVFSMLLSIFVIVTRTDYPFLPVHLSLISAFGVGIPTFFLQLEPSFERVRGKFFKLALRNSVPSSITVFLTALLTMAVQFLFYLPDDRFYGIFVTLTVFIYLYTLYRVYYPPTKLRVIIIAIMAMCFLFLLYYFPHAFSLSLLWTDVLVVVPIAAAEPFVIAFIAWIYDGIDDFFLAVNTKFRKLVHHGKRKKA